MTEIRVIEEKALTAQKLGDFANAIRFWKEVLTIRPDWEGGYAHYYIADCYTRLGDIPAAIRAYEEAVIISPGNNMFLDALESLKEAKNKGYV